MDEEIAKTLENLRRIDNERSDPEAAHGYEDDLLWHVVKLVCEGELDQATELAFALKEHTENCPERVRWYA